MTWIWDYDHPYKNESDKNHELKGLITWCQMMKLEKKNIQKRPKSNWVNLQNLWPKSRDWVTL
jgi:predicted nucleotide-binding protein (sugar kinase/HSP70/actin superfamily)